VFVCAGEFPIGKLFCEVWTKRKGISQQVLVEGAAGWAVSFSKLKVENKPISLALRNKKTIHKKLKLPIRRFSMGLYTFTYTGRSVFVVPPWPSTAVRMVVKAVEFLAE
jgi:hypothetical protein